MTVRGTVKGGVVVLEGGAKLPEGSAVQVTLQQEDEKTAEAEYPPLSERLSSIIGKATGLPPDAARNVDRDLYGLPPR